MEMQKVSKEATWCTDPKAVLGDCNISTAAGNATRARPSFCLLNTCVEKNRSGMWSFISQQLYFSEECEGVLQLSPA